MNPTKSLQAFEFFLKCKGLISENTTPKQGVDAMLEFFQAERTNGYETEGHDTLLFQWGTFDWGQGKHFELDITRQLILGKDAKDENIWQLHMTFRFAPTKELTAIGSGEQWCESLSEIGVFQKFINNSESLQAVANRTDGKFEIVFECAG